VSSFSRCESIFVPCELFCRLLYALLHKILALCFFRRISSGSAPQILSTTISQHTW
uniref:Uncharacterized protein n=1 Tax=Aegilops tauschii subsp. strangulata TaxID=200361 RepID=A0A453RHG2_AEGTS